MARKGEVLSDLIRGRGKYERFAVGTAATLDLSCHGLWLVVLVVA